MVSVPTQSIGHNNGKLSHLSGQPTPTSLKKKRPTIKLACVGSTLMGMYIIFVYLIIITFSDGPGTQQDWGHASSSSGSPAGAGGQSISFQLQRESIEKNAGISNLGQGDKSNSNPSEYSFKVEKDISANTANAAKKIDINEELDSILSGSLLSQTSGIEVNVLHPINGAKNDEVGLRDRRSAHDIVNSVLAAAQLGDRQYDVVDSNAFDTSGNSIVQASSEGGRTSGMPILTAYCEPVNQTSWQIKPLPVRNGPNTKSSLLSIPYPNLKSCQALPTQFPIDTPPVDLDPFLPWIHDVFPSSDGKNVIFIAQNRRRCFNGQKIMGSREQPPKGAIPHGKTVHLEFAKNYFMRPQAALFQHVPVKQMVVPGEMNSDSEPRYRLASHEDADLSGMETRFICRFKSFQTDTIPNLSIVGYTLSQFQVDYDYHTYRKGYLRTATEAGYDNHMIWMSQLLFQCPIPAELQNKVRRGDTVEDDYATLYLDLVPIRTPPRYTPPKEFFPPRYKFNNELEGLFNPDVEWGKEHILPKIEESGRWENIPICMPSLMTYGLVPKGMDLSSVALPDKNDALTRNNGRGNSGVVIKDAFPKIHGVIACTWASTTFRTRSNRAQVGDGKRRLKEWLEFNIHSGFDHIYVYDNSGAFTNEDSLADITGLFPPEKVTRINWPCRICSNRDGNEGERSSQYAAESSCRLRFGTHARWLGSFDTDEYLVPMGNFTSMGEVVDEMDKQNVKVAIFKSSPAKPRFDLIDDPKKTKEADGSFTPTVKEDETFLHTYNCNWEQFPRENTMTHRSKQMYRADYVKLHYVHYATMTVVSQMTEEETKNQGEHWQHRYKERYQHEFDEQNEATMLHSKSKVARNMLNWRSRCRQSSFQESHCNVGFPVPIGVDPNGRSVSKDGWAYNCFLNDKIEKYWWPKLKDAIGNREEKSLSNKS